MPEILAIQHLDREGPGLIAEAAAERGWTLRRIRPYAGDAVPVALGDGQILVVLGGPMGVADLGDPRFPWLEKEVRLLQRCLEERRPVIGICLGAQLLAHAAGGGVVPLACGHPPSPLREVGFGAVSFPRSHAGDPVLAGLDASELVLHWHGDRILLPPGAVLLASSLPCPEQFFRLGECAFGVQFHVEVESSALAAWIREDAGYVHSALGPAGEDRLRADAAQWLVFCRPRWRLLVDNLLDACGGRGPT